MHTMKPRLGSVDNHYRLAINEIRKMRNKKMLVLEIGAGAQIIKKFLPKEIIYHTMDNAEDFWKEQYTYSHNLDAGKFPVNSEMYDIVICNETLEHVMYPGRIVKEIIRVAKKDAVFFFSMPNEYNFLARLYYLIGKKTKVQEPFQVVEKSLHIHLPRVDDILQFFSKYFVIEKVDYVWQSRSSENSFAAREADHVLQSLASIYPSLFARCVSVKVRKKSTSSSVYRK